MNLVQQILHLVLVVTMGLLFLSPHTASVPATLYLGKEAGLADVHRTCYWTENGLSSRQLGNGDVSPAAAKVWILPT